MNIILVPCHRQHDPHLFTPSIPCGVPWYQTLISSLPLRIVLYLSVSSTSLFNPMFITVKQHAVFIHPFPVYPFLFMSPYLLSHSRTSRPCPISQGILLPVRRSQNYIPADFSSTAMTRSAHTSTNLTLSLHMALFFDTHL